MEDLIAYGVAAVSTLASVLFLKNTKMVNGVTEWLLGILNKEGIAKINLDQHRVFILLRTYKNQYSAHLFESPAKNAYYNEFLNIMFSELEKTLTVIIKEEPSNVLTENFIIEQINTCVENIVNRSDLRLNPPNHKVRIDIERWRSSLNKGLILSIHEIATDDLTRTCYLKKYRTLDIVRSFASYVLSSAELTFNNMNGAFDDLDPASVINRNLE